MKRKYGSFVLSMAMIMSLLCGCSATQQKVTPESLLKDVQAASSQLKSVNSEMEMNYDLEVESNGFKIPLEVLLEMDCDFIMEPAQAKIDLSLNLNMFGNNEEQSMEMYFIDKDGEMLAAIYDGNTWDSISLDSSELDELKRTFNQDYSTLFDMSTLKLEQTDVTIDDQSVYLLKGKVNTDIIKNATNIIEEDSIPFDYEGQMIDCEFYIYKDSKLPARIVLDMDKLLTDLMKKSLALESEENVNIIVNQCLFTIDYTDINEIKEIRIPSDAFQNHEVVDF